MLALFKKLALKRKFKEMSKLTDELFNSSYIKHPIWGLKVELVYKKELFGSEKIPKLGETKMSKLDKIEKTKNSLSSMGSLKGVKMEFEEFGSIEEDLIKILTQKGLKLVADEKKVEDFKRVKDYYYEVYNGDEFGYYLIDKRLVALNYV